MQLLVDRWAALLRDDPRNLDLASATRALGLSAARRGQFKSAGATDLQSLAEALNAASTLEEYNARVGRRRAALKAQRLAPGVGEPIAFAISRSDAQAIVVEIGDSLFAKLDDRG